MEFRQFLSSPTHSFPPKMFTTRVPDPNMYSQNLYGHLEDSKPSKPNMCRFPVLPNFLNFPMKMGPSPIGKIACVVGGFVGSKSQRNEDRKEPFPLGKLITQSIEDQLKEKYSNSSQEPNFLSTMMSTILMDSQSSPLSGTGSGGGQSKDACITAGSCLNAAIRLLSECSDDSDFIVFDGADDCQFLDGDDWTDDSVRFYFYYACFSDLD